MQASTVSPVTNFTTGSNATTTKSKEQILIQSSGAMVAVIVIGIIIILAILLIVLKTYNRHTHVSRVLGTSGGSKSRQKMASSAAPSGLPMSNIGLGSVSANISHSSPAMPNGIRLPRVDRSGMRADNSTNSGSTVVTVHDAPLYGNT